MMCKHLIANQPVPEYRNLVRARQPPFLSFERREGRRYAELEYVPDSNDIPAAHMRETINTASVVASPNASVPLMDAKAIRNEMLWMIQHIDSITENGAGAQQIAYIRERIISRISQYRVNVEKNLRSRRTPKTWSNMDTLYLP